MTDLKQTTLPTTALLGAGSMGGAILTGMLQPGVTVAGGIRVTNRTEAKAEALRSEAVTSRATELEPDANRLAVRGARLVVIGVKPMMVADLLAEIADSLAPDAIVISVAAGVPIAKMEAIVDNVVLRAMPNTPSTVGRGVTGLSGGSRASAADLALAETLFSTVGVVLQVPETQIDAVGTISGSGPAYVYFLIEKLTETAIGLGFSQAQARLMVENTFLGASELLAASGSTPSELRRRVTSPNGTTERAIAVLDGADLGAVFVRATSAARARSAELAAG